MERDLRKLVPIIGGLMGARYNLDGYVGFSNGRYVQVFRNGCIEAVQEYANPRDQVGRSALPSQNVEQEIMRHINGAKLLWHELGVEPPALVGCSILGAKGWELAVSYERTHELDRDAVIFPEEVLETFANSYQHDARPIIDMVWQAVGVPRSPNFDQEGNYSP
jgi:hypothetical protein